MEWVRCDSGIFPPLTKPDLGDVPVDWREWRGLLWVDEPGFPSMRGPHMGRMTVYDNGKIRLQIDGSPSDWNVTHYCVITDPESAPADKAQVRPQFVIGQRVRCIDAAMTTLNVDQIYRVKDIADGQIMLVGNRLGLFGRAPQSPGWFRDSRFVPVEELAIGELKEVPSSIAVCPECGGNLSVVSRGTTADGEPIVESLEIGCNHDEDHDDNDQDDLDATHHYYAQFRWQPVRDAIIKWVGAKNSL